MRCFTLSLFSCGALAVMAVSAANPIDTIATTGSFSTTYGTVSQSSPRIPWSDLGFQATASVTQGMLSGAVGGGTQYQLTTSISGSQTFTPGVTQIDLGYTPGWTGSLSTAATGSLGIQVGASIGPFNFSAPVLTDSMTTGVSGLNLSGALNSGSGFGDNTTTPGLGVSGGFGLQVQAFCPFCVTVASGSVGFHVGSQTTQNLDVNPNVTYGDLVWFSNGSDMTAPVNVVGSGGSVNNTFLPPSFVSLGLPATGGAFDMNVLPYAMLSLGVGNEAAVSIPASVSYSYDIFGASGSGFKAGTLYSLSTGLQNLTASGTWYAPDVYSILLDGSCIINPFAQTCSYGTPAVFNPILFLLSGGTPANIPLFNGPPGPPSGGGPGSDFPMLGTLVPGDTRCAPGVPCCPMNPATGGLDCINRVTFTQTRVPEPEVGWLLAAGLLGLCLARVAARRDGARG